jgi:hypothetical protein
VTSSTPSLNDVASTTATSIVTEPTAADSDSEAEADIGDESMPFRLHARKSSDVSLASRALSIEEGRVHRIGQRVRREIVRASSPHPDDSTQDTDTASESSKDLSTSPTVCAPGCSKTKCQHLQALKEKVANMSGEELKKALEDDGWEEALIRLGQNAEELKAMEREHPEDFKSFRDTQLTTLANRDLNDGKGSNDVAVDD